MLPRDPAWMNLASVDNSIPLGRLSPGALAYLGDAVFELYIRSRLLLPPRRLADYHQRVVSVVCAESQALLLQCLESELTESERDLVRRGRNAANNGPRRLAPELYQQATGLETLIGYLYLHNPERLYQLLARLTFPE